MRALTTAGRGWLARATGIPSSTLRLKRMPGATSSSLYLVEDGSDSSNARYVLRLFTLEKWLTEEPDLAQHEAAALREAASTGLSVPELVDYLPGPSPVTPDDPAGFGAPAVLMTHLPGRVELTPRDEGRWLRCLGQALADVHAHHASGFGWRYRSWVRLENVRVPPYTRQTAMWEAAAETYRRWRPQEPDEVFLHRDFHAMNVLFSGRGGGLTVTGVVDWVNACVGPAAADVSHCRMDLVKMKGVAAVEAFTEEYAAARGGFDYSPVWDLDAAFDVAVPDADVHAPWREFGLAGLQREGVQARVEELVTRALVDLGAA